MQVPLWEVHDKHKTVTDLSIHSLLQVCIGRAHRCSGLEHRHWHTHTVCAMEAVKHEDSGDMLEDTVSGKVGGHADGGDVISSRNTLNCYHPMQ